MVNEDVNTTPQTLRELSCADDYDPDSMPVAKAREHIASFLKPVAATERINVRAALGRVLAEDIMSPLDVPAHDNSAMDGYAVRYADLRADALVTLKVVDEIAFAEIGRASCRERVCLAV